MLIIKAKCQYLIMKREKMLLKNLDNLKVFVGYSNTMRDIYKKY